MLSNQITSEQIPETTPIVRFPWEAWGAILSLIVYFLSGDSHLAYAGPYLLWESTTVIVIRFAMLAAAFMFSTSALRRGFSPSLFLTVPCSVVSLLVLLNWLSYLIRWNL